MYNALCSLLGPDHPWADRIHCHRTVDSTNLLAKQMAAQGAPHGTVVLANHQTAGRGRLGRSFHSPDGQGIYMSLLLRPACRSEQLMHLTCAAAVAMCDALEAACSHRPGIKWTNDLVCGKRKLGGILTELGWSSSGRLDYAIVGIGINCSQQPEDFPEDIRGIAASASMLAGCAVSPVAVAAAMIQSLYRMDFGLLTEKSKLLNRYRTDCVTLGQDVSILCGDSVRHARALDIDADGGLIVSLPDGSMETIAAGEVSVRGMYGYL